MQEYYEQTTVTKPVVHMHFKTDNDNSLIPQKATEHSAGFDLRSKHSVVLLNNKRTLIPTGVYTKIPVGYVGLLFPRSSLSKNYVYMTNSVGVIDSDYRGEILASLILNHPTEETFKIEKYERIVQLVIVPVPNISLVYTTQDWDDTERGTGGFGITGKK